MEKIRKWYVNDVENRPPYRNKKYNKKNLNYMNRIFYKTAVKRNNALYTSEGICMSYKKGYDSRVFYYVGKKQCQSFDVYPTPFSAISTEYFPHAYILKMEIPEKSQQDTIKKCVATSFIYRGVMTQDDFFSFYKNKPLGFYFDWKNKNGEYSFLNENNEIVASFYRATPFVGNMAYICKQKGEILFHNFMRTYIKEGRFYFEKMYNDGFISDIIGTGQDLLRKEKMYAIFEDQDNKCHLLESGPITEKKAYDTEEIEDVKGMRIWKPLGYRNKMLACKVMSNRGINYYDIRKRSFILNEWWYNVSFSNGYFKLTNYDLEVNYADVEGNILFKEYLDNGSDVDEHGYITTINKGKKTKIAIRKR